MKLLTHQEIWPDISQSLKVKGRNRVHCAISYIGEGASEFLPLKRGDILICDAEEATIRSGATRASSLAYYHRRGVQIYSKPGLHSKVIAGSKTAWVGSANASPTSAKRKAEASLKVNDPKIVREVRNFVEKLIEDPKTNLVDAILIRELLAIPHKKSDWGSATEDPYLWPKRLATLKTLVNCTEGKEESDHRRLASATKKIAVREKNNLGNDLGLEAYFASSSVRLRKGEFVITGVGEKIFSPGIVVSVKRGKRSSIVWIARPTVQVMEVDVKAFEEYLGRRFSKRVEVSTFKGPNAAKALKFFKG